jgi:hypothetical protein
LQAKWLVTAVRAARALAQAPWPGIAEYAASGMKPLFQQADLSMTATTPLPSGYGLMEATAKGQRVKQDQRTNYGGTKL